MNLRELQEERATLITEMETSLETRDMDGFNAKEARVKEIDALIEGIEKTRALKEPKPTHKEDKGMNLRDEILKDGEIDLSKRAITSGVSTSGNVAVGTAVEGETWENQIVKKSKFVSKLLGAVDVIHTGATHNIPIQGAKIGKFVKTGELGKYVEQNATYTKKQLGATKYTCLAVISDELLEDAMYDIEGDIQQQFVEAFAETMDELLVKGDATEGIEGLNAFTAGLTASTVKKVTEADIVDMFYALPIQYRANATWVLSDATAKVLAKLKDTNGMPLLYTSFNVGGVGEQTMIMGRPVIINNNVADVSGAAVGKFLFFGDLKKAVKVGIRKGMTMKKSTEYKFDEDALAIKANGRVDSKTVLEEAMVCMQSKIA